MYGFLFTSIGTSALRESGTPLSGAQRTSLARAVESTLCVQKTIASLRLRSASISQHSHFNSTSLIFNCQKPTILEPSPPCVTSKQQNANSTPQMLQAKMEMLRLEAWLEMAREVLSREREVEVRENEG